MKQEALQENLQRLRASEKTLSILADGVFARSLEDNAVIYWSRNAQKLYGYSEKEALGKVKFQLLQSGPQDILIRANEHLVKHGYWKGNLIHKRKNGEMIYVESSWIIAKDLDNTPLYIFELSRNITQQVITRQIATFKDEVNTTIKKLQKRQMVLQVATELSTKEFCDFCVVHHKLTEKFYTSQKIGVSDIVVDSIKGLFSNLQKLELLYEVKEGVFVPSPDTLNENLPFPIPGLKTVLKKVNVTSLIIVPIQIVENTMAVMIFGTVSTGNVMAFSGNHFKAAQEVAYDISLRNEQLYLQSQLNSERSRLESLIETVPGVVWEAQLSPIDSGQVVTYISKDVEKLLGYSVEEWLSTPNFWLKIVHPEDKEQAAKKSFELYKSKQQGINIFRWLKKDGSFVWIEARSITVADEAGNPTGMRGVVTDITDRVQKDEQKDIFINLASHELKTPVATLKVYAQLLEKKIHDSKNTSFVSYITKILKQADYITNLINDLLNVSRIEQGKLAYQFEQVNIVEFVQSVIHELDLIHPTHQLRLHIPKRKESYVLIDQERLKQILVNIITNAVKYSPNADKVEVSLEWSKDMINIIVKDFGIGIAKDEQHKIFEKYYRTQNSDNGTFSGLGVGLFISKEIVEKHKGSITVESRKGKGSIFTVTLPLSK